MRISFDLLNLIVRTEIPACIINMGRVVRNLYDIEFLKVRPCRIRVTYEIFPYSIPL